MIFAIDYNDGKVRAKAGATVPASIPSHRQAVLRRAKVIVEASAEVLVVEAVDERKSLPRPRRKRKA